jgi:hypothetical protein
MNRVVWFALGALLGAACVVNVGDATESRPCSKDGLCRDSYLCVPERNVCEHVCVASDPEWVRWPAPPAGPTSYAPQGELVRDEVTRLTWQVVESMEPHTWDEARAYCDGLDLGGISTGWRLPTAAELLSLVDETREKPAINTAFFPSAQSATYWSSSRRAGDDQQIWVVFFSNGSSDFRPIGDKYLARCVQCIQ